MRAIQHDAIRNFPDLDLVLMPGVETPVTPEQANHLAALGITILPDSTSAPEPSPIQPLPSYPAPLEEHDQ